MICVVIKGPTFEEAHHQISKALEYADLVELRLDLFEILDLEALKSLQTHFSIPMIFTLRSQSKRLEDIRSLAALKPQYLDLEEETPPYFIAEIASQYPAVKLILSYHHFEATPEDLEGIYFEMKKTPAYFYKVAVTAQNSLDAMRLIFWAKESDDKLIAISMGSHGQISRILSPMIGCPITYAALEEGGEVAPGQLSAKILIDRYHHRSLNLETTLYGLIGDPVSQSISHETHNRFMSAQGLNAVYIKMQVKAEELTDFLDYAKRLPFCGLSVTMPLKERILSLLDEIDSQAAAIGAVNTLLLKKGKTFGYNTDGIGALNAIESEFLVRGKRMVIIGAGGASKAIAYEAIHRGALVTIINRDSTKAFQMAKRLQCVGKGLEDMADCAKAGYDILINCTPVSMPIDPQYILPHVLVMDITTKPKETMLLQHAMRKNCQIVYGYKMFVEQAKGQFDLWFKDKFVLSNTLVNRVKLIDCMQNVLS